MPHELNSTMVKTKDIARPSVQGFYLSATSTSSRDMLSDICEAFPNAMTEDNLAAVLSPANAVSILTGWIALNDENKFHSSSAQACDYFTDMLALARSGHTWIITSE